jgi:hypothetical protein
MPQIRAANSEPLAINRTAVAHIVAQLRSSSMTRHHFHILLMQAFGRAMFASNHAVITCVNTA